MATDCLVDDDVLAIVCDGVVDARALVHLDGCEACRELVSASVRCGLGTAVSAPPPRAGRFELEALLGVGAAGEVYRARDPRLDRAVALKIVRADRDDPRARARLLAEARAQAQVSDPHVVAVHEAGELDDGVYVAMALDRAESLRTHLALRRATGSAHLWWIAGLFAQAARGLAAVHAAGLVHRDVKPGNLLVGEDGIVRVADFGLADPITPGGSGRGIAGTPAYMAPEQHAGAAVDGRADQFALCVALWEALAGELPFAAGALDALGAAKRRGETRPWPRGIVLPRRLERALARGLATLPEDRFPDMLSLARELVPTSRPRMLRATALAGVALILGIVLIVAVLRGRGDGRADLSAAEACERAIGVGRVGRVADGAGGADVASPSVRFALFARVLGLAAPRGGADAARRVDGHIVRISAELAASVASACAVAPTASPTAPAHDRRMICLARRREELGALLTLLRRGDDALLGRAGDALAGLPDAHECARGSDLLDADPPPTAPDLRRRWNQLSTGIAEVKAWLLAGRPVEANRLAAAMLGEARAIAHRPVLAELLLALGAARTRDDDDDGAIAALRESVALADASRADRVRARAAIELCGVLGHSSSGLAESLAFAAQAEAAIARLGGDPQLEARRLDNLAIVYYGAGQRSDAASTLRRALAEAEVAFGPGAPLAEILDHLGTVLSEVGPPAEARAALERSLAMRESTQGRDHPDIGTTLVNLALLVADAGEYDAALAMLARAQQLYERAVGPRAQIIAGVLTNRAVVEDRMGQRTPALAHFREALVIDEAHLGAADAAVATDRLHVAAALFNLRRFDEAAPVVAQVVHDLEAALGPEHPDLAPALILAGAMAIERGRPGEAIAGLERSRRLQLRDGAPANMRADAAYNLARALLATRRRAEALRAQRAACAAAREAGPAGVDLLAQLATWARREAIADCPPP